eukprot:14509702-Alexandrium_andersonii.AAC.1
MDLRAFGACLEYDIGESWGSARRFANTECRQTQQPLTFRPQEAPMPEFIGSSTKYALASMSHP